MTHDPLAAIRSVAVDAQNHRERFWASTQNPDELTPGTTAGPSSSIPAPAPSRFAAALDAQNPGESFAHLGKPRGIDNTALPNCPCPTTRTQQSEPRRP